MRFGVAIDASLLEDFDRLVRTRGGTRSEILRDLARGEVQKARSRQHVPSVGTLTLVYDHHVRDLTERLTEMQHALGEKVRSTLHVHLDHHRCLEVVVLRGFADELRGEAEKLLATRGVIHGNLELYAERTSAEALSAPASAPKAPSKLAAKAPSKSAAKVDGARGRPHGHDQGSRQGAAAHADDHVHDHGPGHSHLPAKPAPRTTTKALRPPTRVKGSR